MLWLNFCWLILPLGGLSLNYGKNGVKNYKKKKLLNFMIVEILIMMIFIIFVGLALKLYEEQQTAFCCNQIYVQQRLYMSGSGQRLYMSGSGSYQFYLLKGYI